MRNTRLQALITATVTPAGPFDAMPADAGAALTALGVFNRVLLHADGFANPNLMKALVMALRDSPLDGFILNVNAKDELVIGERDGRPLTIHDAWGIPLVAWMVDHPAVHLSHLRRAPENAIVGVIDEGHLRFLADCGLAPRSHVFIPHGGPPSVANPLPAAERSLGVVTMGNVDDPGPLSEWLDTHSRGNATLRGALADGYDAAADGTEIYAALVESFTHRKLNPHPHVLAPFIAALDTHLNQSRRLTVLEAVRGQRMIILGNVTPRAAARLEHHDIRGTTSFAEGLALMSEAKLLLNSRFAFGRGAHERIFYALSRGAVVATEASVFLQRDMDEGAGMIALPRAAADIDDTVCALCGDDARLDRLREQGMATYPARHGWGERMQRLLPLVHRHLETP